SSAVVGNNLTDVGATPLSEHTLLVSKHWNVANSIITNHFVRRASAAAELGLLFVLGLIVSSLAWQARIIRASFYVGLCFAAYILGAFILYVQTRCWIPVFLPLFGGLCTFVHLITWRCVC